MNGIEGCQCAGRTDDDGQPLRAKVATCGHCSRSWCDRCTPVPSARCPFEYDHVYPVRLYGCALTPMMMIPNESGQDFAIRFLPPGARYGRARHLVADSTMVEFYDPAQADDCGDDGNGNGPLGWFIARYYTVEITGDRLALVIGDQRYRIDAPTMMVVRNWLDDVIEGSDNV